MNNNDFEIILDLATKGERYSAEEFAATRAAEVEMAARLTPITPEALLADGWKQASGDDMVYFTMQAGQCLEVEFNIAEEWSVTIDMPEAMTGILFRGVRNMHDLRELVRLLGGAL